MFPLSRAKLQKQDCFPWVFCLRFGNYVGHNIQQIRPLLPSKSLDQMCGWKPVASPITKNIKHRSCLILLDLWNERSTFSKVIWSLQILPVMRWSGQESDSLSTTHTLVRMFWKLSDSVDFSLISELGSRWESKNSTWTLGVSLCGPGPGKRFRSLK